MKELSVDLIESCLNQIYKIRKSQLSHRTQKHQDKILKQQKVINAKYDLTIKPKDDVEEEDEEDEENEQLVKQLSSKSSAPPPPAKVSSGPTYVDSGKAHEIFDAFCNEYDQVSKSIESDEDLEEACNYLVDSYLTQQFDRMKPSAEVSKLKMTMSKMIEDLASNGVNNAQIEESKTAIIEDTFTKPAVGKLLNTSKSTKGSEKTTPIPKGDTYSTSSKAIAGKEPTKPAKHQQEHSSPSKSNTNATTTASPNTTKSSATASGATATDRKNSEKTKIKQQYEAYMNLKKKYLEHEDHKVIADYEQLNNDIQNVLASIQTTPTAPDVNAKTADGKK